MSAGVSSDWDPAQMAIGAGIGWVSGGVASGVAGATTGHLLTAVVETYTGDVISSVGFATASIGGSVAGGMVAGGLSSAIYGGNVLEGMGYGMLFGGIGGGIFGSIDYYGRGLQGNAYDFGPSAGAQRGVIYDAAQGWGDWLAVSSTERSLAPDGSYTIDNTKVTHYCNCKICTGKSPGHPAYGITTDGTTAGPGTVAADPSKIPFGSNVTFRYPDGTPFSGTVHDTGGAIKGDRIDIWMSSHKAAKEAGRFNTTIRVTPP